LNDAVKFSGLTRSIRPPSRHRLRLRPLAGDFPPHRGGQSFPFPPLPGTKEGRN
jgi:hypothetical protein